MKAPLNQLASILGSGVGPGAGADFVTNEPVISDAIANDSASTTAVTQARRRRLPGAACRLRDIYRI
jgi:hypothetical protein